MFHIAGAQLCLSNRLAILLVFWLVTCSQPLDARQILVTYQCRMINHLTKRADARCSVLQVDKMPSSVGAHYFVFGYNWSTSMDQISKLDQQRWTEGVVGIRK